MTTILVVDADPEARRTLRAILESEGHAVLEAHNGIEAVRLCRQARPALVIMEIFLPEREGIETIVELQEQCRDVKIFAVSGSTEIQGRILPRQKRSGRSAPFRNRWILLKFLRP